MPRFESQPFLRIISAAASLALGVALAPISAQAQHAHGGGGGGGGHIDGGGFRGSHDGGGHDGGGHDGGYWGGSRFSFGLGVYDPYFYNPFWYDPFWSPFYYAPPLAMYEAPVYAPPYYGAPPGYPPPNAAPPADGAPPSAPAAFYGWPIGIQGGSCNRAYLDQMANQLTQAAANGPAGAVAMGGLYVGRIAGGSAGARMTTADQACVMQGLELGKTGAAVAWQGVKGVRFEMRPTRTYYRQDGRPCRDYDVSARIGNARVEETSGSACRGSYGTWSPGN